MECWNPGLPGLKFERLLLNPDHTLHLPHCYAMQVCVLDTQRGHAIRIGQSLEQRKLCCRAMQEVGRLMPHRTPNSSKGVSQAILKGRRGRGMVDGCKCLGVGIFCSCSFPHRSHHHLPVNRQRNKCYSLFCDFLSLCD